ncbi:MAG: ATP-binding cassette domain-containing protein [Cyclobacteriaceae bacterium]|nr:ATP-binding cassette domain-containing protein [Cyclobacteriaceae bacterium]
MNEELLMLIVRLFAIVAKERITEDERNNLREFLLIHVSHDSISYFIEIFDKEVTEISNHHDLDNTDSETAEYIADWAKVLDICKVINESLTKQQKLVLLLKLIELMLQDDEISERQSNLIFYISEAIHISQQETDLIKMFLTGQDTEDLDYKEILIVDEGSTKHKQKSAHIVSRSLTGMIVVLRIADAGAYFIKYLGISNLTLNGNHFRSRKIYVFPTGSIIRGNKINSIYYSDVVSKFIKEETVINISFEAQNIYHEFKSGVIGLQNINISEEGGKLVGIMGASGSGKSTLLSILDGTSKPTQGTVLLNGKDLYNDSESLTGVIGLVPQDDFLIEELSVYQNLYYAARLTFGNHTIDETHKLVQSTLKSLGLSETKDLLVGSTLEKTISGGQRKRLNIGLELLRKPSVLFVDEPTSGLSSNDSINIMDLLKELSLQGKLIFVVIHQPSSDIFKMFDQLIILDVGGYQVYYGNPVEALVYFKTIVNMVNKDQGACMECGNIKSEQIFNILENKVVNEYGRFTENRRISAAKWHEYFRNKITIPTVERSNEPIEISQKNPGRFQQLKIFGIRDIRTKLANKQYLFITFLEAPVLAIFLGMLIRYYEKLNGDSTYLFMNNDNIPVYFFMTVIIALFIGLTLSAEELIKDRKMLQRESFLHLSRASYLASKIGVQFSISAIQTLSFVIIGNLILGVNGMTISMWAIMFFTAGFANLLGLNISSAFKSAVTVYILIPLLVIPQLVLSGVIISFDKFNPQLSNLDKVPAVGNLMASRWAFEALVVEQFKHNAFARQFYAYDREIALADYYATYYVPTLETHLSEIGNKFDVLVENPDSIKIVKRHLDILKYEIDRQLKLVGAENFSNINSIELSKFDREIYNETEIFLSTLKKFYHNKHQRWNRKIDSIKFLLTDTPSGLELQQFLRTRNFNKSLSDMLQGKGATTRIVEGKGELIQKIYPIYYRPDESNFVEIASEFYAPEKIIGHKKIDTLFVNILVIILMTLFLIISLYFDWLKKLMNWIEDFKLNRKYKKNSE